MPAPTIRTRRTPPPEFGPALTAGREAAGLSGREAAERNGRLVDEADELFTGVRAKWVHITDESCMNL